MIERLYLIDRDPELVAAWQDVFADFPEVQAECGDYFQRDAEIMVSPANSFGFMDGGLDYAIRERLGTKVEEQLQRQIIDQYHGELPIGHCLLIKTGHHQWPVLASIPTMRVPSLIHDTLNVYYAFRALLLASTNSSQAFTNVVCPGLGTGIGGMSARSCAGQMSFAYKQFKAAASIPSAREILISNRELEGYREK